MLICVKKEASSLSLLDSICESVVKLWFHPSPSSSFSYISLMFFDMEV